MKTLTIRGGRRLNGTVSISGAKNAVLPLLAATAVHGGIYRLENCPALSDVDDMADILKHLGCLVERNADVIDVDSRSMCRTSIPYGKMGKMRSSLLIFGALMARFGQAQLWLPGGCNLGPRPIDLHVLSLRKLGAQVDLDGDAVRGVCGRLHGGTIELPMPSVGATENALLAAMGADGPVTVVNAAKEPDVQTLARFLCAMGAEITGEGTGVIRIIPPQTFRDAQFRVPPDRIEAATYLCALASAGGELTLTNVDAVQLLPVIDCLREAGMQIETDGQEIRARSGKLHAIDPVCTGPYPDFPTDAQPLLTAALLKSEGTTCLEDRVFESRFRHVRALRDMGANITVDENKAYVTGVEALHGATVVSTDIRGGAAMVIAALGAEGVSHISDIRHLFRGYDCLCEKLRGLGADISLDGE